MDRSGHVGVLQVVLFAIFLASATAFLLILFIAIMLVGTEEDMIALPVLRLAFLACILLLPLSVAGLCWAWIGWINAIARRTTMKLAGGSFAAAVLGIVVIGPIERMTPVDSVDTEAEARPILERLVRREAKSFPDTIRTVDLPQQIRNVTIKGPSMTFEADWTRYINFDLDTGCGEVVSLLAYVGSEGPVELSGHPKRSCRPTVG